MEQYKDLEIIESKWKIGLLVDKTKKELWEIFNLQKKYYQWIYRNRITLITYPVLLHELSQIWTEDFTDVKAIIGALIILSAFNWIYTEQSRRQTRSRIERLWKLDEWYFIRKMWDESRYPYVWYCQLQWMYLAAKEMWELETFFEMKKKLTNNILPNF